MEKEKITAQTCPVSGPVQGYFRSPPIFVLPTNPQQRANNHHWGTVTSLVYMKVAMLLRRSHNILFLLPNKQLQKLIQNWLEGSLLWLETILRTIFQLVSTHCVYLMPFGSMFKQFKIQASSQDLEKNFEL